MSRTVDIDFTFNEPVDVSKIIRLLMGAGMRLSSGGEVSYLIDEDGMFDWRKEVESRSSEVISIVSEGRWNERTVGITLYFSESSAGGDFLFHPGRDSLSFVVSVNPKIIPGSLFCDIGWYLTRLIPTFEPLGLIEVETRDSA